MHFRKRYPLLILSVCISAHFGSGQVPYAPSIVISGPTFEVATIKPSAPGETEQWNQSANNFIASNQTLKSQIDFAYDIKNYQLLGEPRWVDLAKYTFHAKATDSDITTWKKLSSTQQIDQIRSMVKRLLEERCNLKVRWETQQRPIFRLIIDKKGIKIKPVLAAVPNSLVIAPGLFKSNGISMTDFTRYLEAEDEIGNRKILDQTGLQGFYRVSLRWKSVQVDSDSSGISLFTALPEELGLKLVPQKGPVSVLIVDHVDRPSEN